MKKETFNKAMRVLIVTITVLVIGIMSIEVAHGVLDINERIVEANEQGK